MTQMAQGQAVAIRSIGKVSGYRELKDDFKTWVPMLLEIWRIESELRELAEAERSIGSLSPSRDDFRKLLPKSFESYRRRYISRLAKFLADGVRSPDPLSRVERLEFLATPFFPLNDFVEAEALLPDELFSEVPSKERQAELNKIHKQRAKLESRLAELRCPPYIALTNGGHVEDLRQMLFEAWAQKQRESCEAVTAQGLTLEGAPEAERDAYVALGISAYINRRSDQVAAPRV